MASDDVRAILDPLQVVRAARPKFREIPAHTYTPPASTADPDPAPVTIPARTEVYVDPAEMPAEFSVDGRLDLASQLANLQAAVAKWMDLEIRTVHASVTYAPTAVLRWDGNSTRNVELTWTSIPGAPVRGAIARVDASLVAAGKVAVEVVPSSVTDRGCTVAVSVVGTTGVVINSSLPVTVSAEGIYLAWPTFQG